MKNPNEIKKAMRKVYAAIAKQSDSSPLHRCCGDVAAMSAGFFIFNDDGYSHVEG